MPRHRRVFLPGGVYHVYSRVARNEEPFADPAEAEAFVEIVREVKARDELIVFAWCLMPSHYHLALRAGTVPLWRSLASIQVRVSKGHNRRHRLRGPLWQGRYRAALVEDQTYFDQLLLYIHLNPVKAGLVDDPARYPWSGHRELLGKVKEPLVDVGDALLMFGEKLGPARRAYARRMRGDGDEQWLGERPGLLPWWRELREEETAVEPTEGTPYVDYLGRSTFPERPPMDAGDFLEQAARSMGVELSDLAGRSKGGAISDARSLAILLGIERYGQRIRELAAVLNKNPGSLSFAANRFAKRRAESPELRAHFEEIDASLRGEAAR